MKSEVIIKNWLMAWLRPDILTEYNKSARPPLSNDNFGEFINIFRDERKESQFTEKEAETLERIILKPLKFGTGYPLNEGEAIQHGTVYVIGGGWNQTDTYPGANYWNGRAATHIAVSGLTSGGTLNMAEPSLMIQVITSLLIAGHNYFTANHMLNPVITETLYAQDESSSMEKGFSMRSLTITYESKRHGVITHG